MTGFAVLAAYAGRASALEVVLVLGLVGGATVFSLVQSAQYSASDAGQR